MSDTSPPPSTPGDRIAKVLARAGIASRREAERLIAEGRVAVNGKTLDSPARNVMPNDRITFDGEPVAAAEPPRLWRYHKPTGLVTTARDEKGRETVFDALPEDLPRVMSVGRLDLNSEGLLLLTNDGEIKRRLELPSTGWLRRYRVRVNGAPVEEDLAPLRDGIEVEGERFKPMEARLDRQQGANAWLTIGLREGRNREIRRAMGALGLTVNRLIRISYGPFRLGELKPGEVEEIKGRILRDQLGLEGPEPPVGTAKPKRAPRRKAPAKTHPDPERAQAAKPGAKPGTKPGAIQGTKPGAIQGTKPGAKPGAKLGAKLGAKPGAKPRPTRGKHPGSPHRGGRAD